MHSLKGGFTLIELIVGIVLLAIALTGMLGLLINQGPRTVDPVQQVRAAQLAQRILGEILQKSFDEHSDHNGGRYRCGETDSRGGITDCSSQADYGPDGEPAPYAFNDVDDFDTGGKWVDANFFTQTAAGISADEYPNYQIRIAVSPVDFSAGTFKTCSDPCAVGKQIMMQLRLPDQSLLDFSVYRGNY